MPSASASSPDDIYEDMALASDASHEEILTSIDDRMFSWLSPRLMTQLHHFPVFVTPTILSPQMLYLDSRYSSGIQTMFLPPYVIHACL